MAASRPGQEDVEHSQSRSESPSDNYFNDLSQQAPAPNEQQPRSKRMACVLCRKRKLRCDGARPACATCARLSHDCIYDEVRKKSGPKRGYVKALEARLAQVETMLKTQDPIPLPEPGDISRASSNSGPSSNNIPTDSFQDFNQMDISNSNDYLGWTPGLSEALMNDPGTDLGPMMASLQEHAPVADPIPPSWDLIGLDIEEPLPLPDIIEELHHLFFTKVHPTSPVIHRPRYLMAMSNSSPRLRPPVPLQYIIWAFAGSVSDKYQSVHRHYYERARRYFDRDEMRGQGENIVNLQHVQALVLIASYEFKYLMFPRAWQTTGRASRLGLMLGLHKIDGPAMDVKQCLPPPKDWIEREERRRTYWGCFEGDRYASIGTGWPMLLEEADITTNLPCSEDAYEMGTPEPSISLKDALKPGGASQLSAFGAVIVLACLFGRNLTHLHRPGPNENEADLNGDFWKRHRLLDNILLSTSLALPESLRLPMGISNPNLVFMNMCLHTSTICLHQAAIFKAEKHRALAKVSVESKIRCVTAAAEIASIMKLTSHQDMAGLNPFTCFCVYVSARVFVQYMKTRPRDAEVSSSLQFMLSAMHAMKRKNPLADSFLVQLDVDLEAAGLDEMRNISPVSMSTSGFQGECPLTHIMPNGESRPPPATFGNNGLAVHTSPTEHKKLGTLDWETTGGPYRADPPPDLSFDPSAPVSSNRGPARAAVHPGSNFSGMVPMRFDPPDMPLRQKTSSSTGQSPQTLSPDADTSGSGSSGQTPSSMQNGSYGRVSSTTSITSPPLSQDATGILANTGFMEMASADQDMTFLESDIFPDTNSLEHASTANVGEFDLGRWTQFVRSSEYFRTGEFMEREPKTGMTPRTNVADLGSMTDAEFDSIMNGVAQWENNGMDQAYQMPGS